jgi:transcriptional regulator with XRE-family HTH domain
VVIELDGPSLRSLREHAGVPLRKVARVAGMSHGHLSKVERAETGRPVTPAVLAAYEKATGVRLATGHGDLDAHGWRPGRLSELSRARFNARIASVAVGGPLAEPPQLVAGVGGTPSAPVRVQAADVAQLRQAAGLCTRMDLRFGGGVADPMVRTLLRWAVGLLPAARDDAGGLHAAVGVLAQRAGWAAFDAGVHHSARAMFVLALYTATAADDADLRAHVLADVAAQHQHLGHFAECLQVARLGEVDERVSAPVRMVLHAVKARAYAANGDSRACHAQLDLARQAQTTTGADGEAGGGWQATVATPGRWHAAAGHALAVLAARTNTDTDRAEAARLLTQAVDQLDPSAQARAVALCTARLAALHLNAGELDTAAGWGHHTLKVAAGVRSARLAAQLHAVGKAAAAAHPREAVIAELVTAIDAGHPAAGSEHPGPGHSA